MNFIFGQFFSFLAVILSFIAYQFKTQKHVLIFNTAVTVSMMLSYLFLGAYSGMALNVIGIVRNIVYYYKNKRMFSSPAIPYIFALAMALVGAMAWQGAVSLLIIAALAINTVFMSKDPQPLRISILLTSTMILIYDILVMSYGGVINEAVAIISSIIGIIRYKKKKEL